MASTTLFQNFNDTTDDLLNDLFAKEPVFDFSNDDNEDVLVFCTPERMLQGYDAFMESFEPIVVLAEDSMPLPDNDEQVEEVRPQTQEDNMLICHERIEDITTNNATCMSQKPQDEQMLKKMLEEIERQLPNRRLNHLERSSRPKTKEELEAVLPTIKLLPHMRRTQPKKQEEKTAEDLVTELNRKRLRRRLSYLRCEARDATTSTVKKDGTVVRAYCRSNTEKAIAFIKKISKY